MKTAEDWAKFLQEEIMYNASQSDIIVFVEQIRREQHEADMKAVRERMLNVKAIVCNNDPAFLDLIAAIEKTLNSITFESTQED